MHHAGIGNAGKEPGHVGPNSQIVARAVADVPLFGPPATPTQSGRKTAAPAEDLDDQWSNLPPVALAARRSSSSEGRICIAMSPGTSRSASCKKARVISGSDSSLAVTWLLFS